MAPIPLHPNSTQPPESTSTNPLPQLLQTPTGLALLELQGTINLPEHDDQDTITSSEFRGGVQSQETPIGRLVFAEYDPQDPKSTAWMKRVYLYVGKHQRLSGEVKKLPKAIAVIRKRVACVEQVSREEMIEGQEGELPDELEVVQIVKWKILFSTRPEPVGTRVANEELVID